MHGPGVPCKLQEDATAQVWRDALQASLGLGGSRSLTQSVVAGTRVAILRFNPLAVVLAG